MRAAVIKTDSRVTLAARFLLLITSLVVGLVTANSAAAGGYVAISCTPDLRQIDGWSTIGSSPAPAGLTAYGLCTAREPVFGGGISDDTPGTRGMRAGWEFRTPPGTLATAVTASYDVSGFDGGWVEGVWNAATDEVLASFSPSSGPLLWHFTASGFATTRLGFGIGCWNDVCRAGSRGEYFSVWNIAVTLRDDVPPTLVPAPLAAGWAAESLLPINATADDNLGVQSVQILLDGLRIAETAQTCKGVRPCPGPASIQTVVDTSQLADGVHELRWKAVDAAGNVTDKAQSLQVDSHAPLPPRQLTVAGGDAWRTRNTFDVTWQNDPREQAPITVAHYTLCPAGRARTPLASQVTSGDSGSIGWRACTSPRPARGG